MVEPDAPPEGDRVAETTSTDFVRLGQQRDRAERLVVREKRLEDVPHDLVREHSRRHLDIERRRLASRGDLEDAAQAGRLLGAKVAGGEQDDEHRS